MNTNLPLKEKCVGKCWKVSVILLTDDAIKMMKRIF